MNEPRRLEVACDFAAAGEQRELAGFARAAARLPASVGDVTPDPATLWGPELYGLAASSLWRRLDGRAQQQVLARANAAVLREAFYIERAGLTYAARMILEATSADERHYYATVAGDEAWHFELMRRLGAEPSWRAGEDPFLELIASVIERGSRALAVAVIQVFLEGWGLVHYRRLAEACRVEAGIVAFRSILSDEARHHGGGLALAPKLVPEAGDEAAARTLLDQVRWLLELGPVALMAGLDEAAGGLSALERRAVERELGVQDETRRKLDTLARLCARAPVLAASASVLTRDSSRAGGTS